MSTTMNQAPQRRWIALLLGAAGVTALLAAALPELTVAGEAVVQGAASPATVQIENFTFAPGDAHRHCRDDSDLEERGRQTAPDRRHERDL